MLIYLFTVISDGNPFLANDPLIPHGCLNFQFTWTYISMSKKAVSVLFLSFTVCSNGNSFKISDSSIP